VIVPRFELSTAMIIGAVIMIALLVVRYLYGIYR
jgi:hypothetical protein